MFGLYFCLENYVLNCKKEIEKREMRRGEDIYYMYISLSLKYKKIIFRDGMVV